MPNTGASRAVSLPTAGVATLPDAAGRTGEPYRATPEAANSTRP